MKQMDTTHPDGSTPFGKKIAKNADQVTDLLKLLGHPGRLQILMLLVQQERLNVTTMRDALQWDQGLISHHLIKLKDRKILTCQRVGRMIYYSIADGWLVELLALISFVSDRVPVGKGQG